MGVCQVDDKYTRDKVGSTIGNDVGETMIEVVMNLLQVVYSSDFLVLPRSNYQQCSQ